MKDRSTAVTDCYRTSVTPRRAGRRCHGLAQKAAVVLAVLAGTFVAAPPAHAADCTPGSYPPAQCTASVSATVVPEGGRLTVSGPGFAPGSRVSVDILSHLVHLKTVKADAAGNAQARVHLPDSIEEGTHTLMLTGHNPDGSERQLSATIEIVEGEHEGAGGNDAYHDDSSVLASTGTAGTAAMAVGGGVLLATGGLTLRLARRRRRTRAS